MPADQKTIRTIGKVLLSARDYLDRHGSKAPRLEAEQLMAYALNTVRVDLYVNFDRPLTLKERSDYKDAIKIRATGKPIQYITGEQGFRRMVLKVTPDVLIPRPETELLVDVVIEKLKLKGATVALSKKTEQPSKDKFFDILDIGTGSGAIALSLAFELLNVRVWALDISEAALSVAGENAKTYRLEDRVTFFQSDLFSKVNEFHPDKFDALVANPPYVGTEEIAGLPDEVRFEPELALAAGPGGLDYYRRIGLESGRFLKQDGFLAVEIGAEQARSVGGILQKESFADIRSFKDLAGRDRVVLARRNAKVRQEKSCFSSKAGQ